MVLAVESGAALSLNANLEEKQQFYYVFLKVKSPLTGYLQQLRGGTMLGGSGISPPAHYQNRQNPYSSSCLGKNHIFQIFSYMGAGSL